MQPSASPSTATLATVSPEAATQRLVETGVLGSLLVLALAAIVVLWRQVAALQDARLTDAKFYSDKLLGVAEQCRATIDNVTDALTKK